MSTSPQHNRLGIRLGIPPYHLFVFFNVLWDTPPCLFSCLSSRSGFKRAFRQHGFGQIVGLVSLFLVFGIRVHALDEPPLHSSKSFGISPLEKTAGPLGALEIEAVLVLLGLGHGQDEGQVAIAAQVRGLVTAHVDGVQGVSHLVQIEVHVVGTAGHVALGVVVQGGAAVVSPHVPLLGVHFVVDQGFVATGARLDSRIDLLSLVEKHLVEQVSRVKVRDLGFVGENHLVHGPQNLLSVELGLDRSVGRTGLDSWHDDW